MWKSVEGWKMFRYAGHMPLDKYIHKRLAMLPGPIPTISNRIPEYPPKQEIKGVTQPVKSQ